MRCGFGAEHTVTVLVVVQFLSRSGKGTSMEAQARACSGVSVDAAACGQNTPEQL